MTEREHVEIINFHAACIAVELISQTDKPESEQDQLILLAVSYGPAINTH